jgi:hypothetical protein
LKNASPLTTPIVFNCGMGAVRTTYAMVAACIVRRKQCIQLGLNDPYAKEWKSGGGLPSINSHAPVGMNSSDGTPAQATYVLEQGEFESAIIMPS